MTVAQLIKKLQELPENAHICTISNVIEGGEKEFVLVTDLECLSLNEYNEVEPPKENYKAETGNEFPDTNQELVILKF